MYVQENMNERSFLGEVCFEMNSELCVGVGIHWMNKWAMDGWMDEFHHKYVAMYRQ